MSSFLGVDYRTELSSLEAEYAEVAEALRLRYELTGLTHPGEFGIGDSSTFFLWVLLRYTRPEVVVETGIANGHSSFLILNALGRNQKGVLHSFDISLESGRLVPDELQQLWVKHLVSSTRGFQDELESIGPLCLFIHDSDHDFFHMRSEYAAALPLLRRGGILASDDIDWNYAFLDCCRQLEARPTLLVQSSKVFGAVRV